MEEVRDRNGLTLAEFLARYREKNYEKPALTADLAVFCKESGPLRVLLVRRGGHPFLGAWALPGGFVGSGESADAAAGRELAEETGLAAPAYDLLGFYSAPGRDPRGWVVSAAYVALLRRLPPVRGDDDAAEAAWFDLAVTPLPGGRLLFTLTHEETVLRTTVQIKDPRLPGPPRSTLLAAGGLAFDHGQIIADGYLRLTTKP